MGEFKRTLVTSALPYANGPLHIGHIAGAYLPGDIFVRYSRLKGDDIVYICGTDEYGVPITISADKEGKTPQDIVDHFYPIIKDSFEKLGIKFDNFSRTTNPIHTETAQDFFLKFIEKDYLVKRESEQWFDPEKNMFLPDRYVTGTCPECGHEGAKGDQCEVCGKWYESIDLKNPISQLSGKTPILRKTTHWYMKFNEFQESLKDFIDTRKNWKNNVINYCKGWLDEGLEERAVTRDLDWGIPVPLEEAEGKKIYVWFEAVLGYISATKEWAQKKGDPSLWEKYWKSEESRLIHFIGKDNIYFHALMFPAMLMGYGGYVLEERPIFLNGHIGMLLFHISAFNIQEPPDILYSVNRTSALSIIIEIIFMEEQSGQAVFISWNYPQVFAVRQIKQFSAKLETVSSEKFPCQTGSIT